MSSPWSEERIEQMKALWKEGLSCSQIAKRLKCGVSRNAVIGKLHRLGLSGRREPSAPVNRKVRPASPSRRAAVVRPPDFSPISSPLLDCSTDVVRVRQVATGECKWPVGDPRDPTFGFCGAATTGRYCAEHAARAYQPVKRKASTAPTAYTSCDRGAQRPASTVMNGRWS